MNPTDLPTGLRVRDLESDLHCGPDLEAEAEAKAQAEDEAYERKQGREMNKDL